MTHANNIIEILTTETFALKQELLVKTHTYANHEYARIINNIPAMEAELDALTKEFNHAVMNRLPATILGVRYAKLSDKVYSMKQIQKNGMFAFVEKAMKNAESHYTTSIKKLAMKIDQKGMDMTNFKMTSGYVGINLEMRMTDGVKSVNAWTIWAAQDSVYVKPHYRYLVK
jgi:hypothetical protein